MASSFLVLSCGGTGLDNCKQDGSVFMVDPAAAMAEAMAAAKKAGDNMMEEMKKAMGAGGGTSLVAAGKVCIATEDTDFIKKMEATPGTKKVEKCDDGFKACAHDDKGDDKGWGFYYDLTDKDLEEAKKNCDEKDGCTWYQD